MQHGTSSTSTARCGRSPRLQRSSASCTGRRSRAPPFSFCARSALACAECPWVFPGDTNGKPVQEIKRFWHDVRKKAKLTNVRIHDLRHTFASMLVSGGMSLPMIGKLLGHTQVQTTQRYAHLFDDPLRVGLNQVGEMLRPKLKLVANGETAEAEVAVA